MSVFGEVIAGQQAQADEPRKAAAQRLATMQALGAISAQGFQNQLAGQRFQMEKDAMARDLAEQTTQKANVQGGMAAYLDVLKNRPTTPAMGSVIPRGYGPDVKPMAYSKPPEMAALDFDTVSRSLLKKNPTIDPQQFVIAMKQFEPQFEQQDKMKLAQFQKHLAGAGSVEEQIYTNSLRSGRTPEEAALAAREYKRAAPEEAGLTATEKARAKLGVSREGGLAKAQSALAGFEQQAGIVTKTIDDALATVGPYSTGYGAALAALPNTDARKLQNYISTIKANIGFDKLQNMRENSPTGGALGSVSDFENRLLQAVNGALDPMQSDQLVQNLNMIKTLYPQVLAERKAAFNKDYGAADMRANGASPRTINFNDLPD